MKLLKTAGIALFVAAVTAISVVVYIDYRIDRATEAIMAPIHETTDRVTDTIDGIGKVVDDAASTAETIRDDAVGTIGRSIGEGRERVLFEVEQAREDVVYEVESAREAIDHAGERLGALGDMLG